MKTKNVIISVLLCVVTLMGIGCSPVKILDVKEIKPNETAWVIPLDTQSQSGQAKFNSIDFLNQKKVASKRIMIDKVERSIGRMPWDIEWIPSVRVITVDRSLVTREWTDNKNTGTAENNQGIPVNTMDNIGLTVGLTITVNIDEDDASTYLYYHGEKSLADVCDQNIRSYAVAELNRKISAMNLIDFQKNQSQLYSNLFIDAAAYYKTKGVTIQYLGNAEGWEFKDPKIQDGINKTFIAQQDNKTAAMEQDAQRTRNATTLLNAETQKSAAMTLFAAKEASEFQNELAINKMKAQASLEMAEKWNGSLPSSILPSNSPLLLNLGQQDETKK